jgi:lipopolysaccharide export system permease protein
VVSGQAYEGNFIPAAENGEARIPYKQQSKLKISDYLSVPEYWEFNREKFQQINGKKEPFEVSSLLSSLSSLDKISVLRNALGNARQNSQKITNSKRRFEQMEKDIFKHQIYWHKKLTLSFACIIFFFIGAPLGSIIRKGGLGTPLVISVILFIVYYIISISGENFVEKGVLPATLGMWLSSMIFLPVGVFLTYKATNDSVILNTETYIRTFKKFITFRLKPSIAFMRTNR